MFSAESLSLLRQQFERVLKEGWWSFLETAANTQFPSGDYDAVDLFAIGSRESSWSKTYLQVAGDNGNGFGLMQVDKRAFPEWVASGNWHDAAEGIAKGAEVLRQKLDDIESIMGASFTLKALTGKLYTCPQGKVLTPTELRRVALAAYNCGRWALFHVSKGRDPDYITTGQNYSADVLARAAVARPWAPQ